MLTSHDTTTRRRVLPMPRYRLTTDGAMTPDDAGAFCRFDDVLLLLSFLRGQIEAVVTERAQ